MKNLLQEKVQNHVYGPAAVLAGAGTGKTSTLVNRIKKLSEVTDATRIVMLTFTNAAADEMRNKAVSVNPNCKDIIACTYHKYCGKLLRKYGRTIGIEPWFEILVSKKYQTLIEYVKSSNEYYETLKDFPSASKLESIYSILTNNEEVSIDRLIYGTKYSSYGDDIMTLYNEVKKFGKANYKFNFDDMLVYTNELLDNETICKAVAASFDFLMVDEFQDTNSLQLSILLKLGKYNKNIMVVGDISQSIYKFRGAKVENIQTFIDSFPDCTEYKLSLNYRSSNEILDAVNSIMNKNVMSWNYTYMVANNDDDGKMPTIIQHGDDVEQAAWIIAKINDCLSNGYSLNQIAIIERKSMSSFKLENLLAKAKIPFIKRGGRKLTDYICVDDVLSFMQVLNKNDTFNWFNMLKLIPGVGNKTATDISSHCKEKDFLDKYKKRKFYSNLYELQNNLVRFKTLDMDRLFDEVADYYFNLREYKIANSKMSASAKFDARETITRDREIITILKDIANDYADLKTFLADIALDSLKTNDNENHLLITTIHGAKGLEWPVVILIDIIDEEYKDFEEELRCLYVALTRAETELCISIPKYTIRNGQPEYNQLSRFFNGSEKFFAEKR